MSVSILDRALDYTFENEGGFSNVREDRGGATRFGITRAEASRWRKRPVSIAEMKAFPLDEAKDIYFAWYWRPLGCDKLTAPGVAIAMFDIGVVRGIAVPPKYAQRICNKYGAHLEQDGHIGPKTIAAVNAMAPNIFITDYAALCEEGFRAIAANNPSQQVFLRGWTKRAHRLLTLI